MPDVLTIPDAADIWDDFAQQFILNNPTVRFAVAERPEDRAAIYRARYAQVIQKGWAKPETMPDGLEYDTYDEQALHLVGWQDKQMIIVGRLVFPSPDHLLPTENAFGLTVAPHQKVVDTGRAILLQPNDSDSSHTLFLGLMGYAWQEMRARGYYHICAAMTGSMRRLYRTMGLYWQVLGESNRYWGAQRYPCKYDLVKSVQAFMAPQASSPSL